MRKLLLLLVFLVGLIAHAAAENVITFTTSKDVGEKVSLAFQYSGSITITGVKEEAAPSSSHFDRVIRPSLNEYTLTSQTVTITGDVTRFICLDDVGYWDLGEITSLVANSMVLETLWCYQSGLASLDVTNSPNLIDLDCGGNGLTSLNISNNTMLGYLDCTDNELTSLDVTKNKYLTELFCQTNPLMMLDVSNNTALVRLDCQQNQLTSLDVSNNTALGHLDCGFNQLTSLDVSNNLGLSILGCERNKLPSLNVAKNTKLTFLDCTYNNLTSLDVSENTLLGSLYCGSNQLTSLDVSKNVRLKTLQCENNHLTALDVSNNPSLDVFSCKNNHLTALTLAANTKISNSSYSNVTSQTKTVECLKLNGYYVVPIDNIAENGKVSNIKVNGTAYTNASSTYVLTSGDNKYLVIGDGSHVPAVGTSTVTYDYATDGSITEVQTMDVTLTTLNVPKIVLTTGKAVGSIIDMRMAYTGDVVIEGATGTVGASGSEGHYTLTSQTVTIYGDITDFYCIGQQLTALDVSQSPALTLLRCGSNQLTSLDVSQNTLLTDFRCAGNQLASLDVTNNTALTDFQCYGNQLSSLDLSQNGALQHLWCQDNQLSSLDLTNNTALIDFGCENNHLTALTLAVNTKIKNNSRAKNQTKTVKCFKLDGYYVVPVDNGAENGMVDNIKVNGTAYSPAEKVKTIDGNKYLVIGDASHPAAGATTVTYDYTTGNSFEKVKAMDVTLTTTAPGPYKIVLTTGKAVGSKINMMLRYTGSVTIDGVEESVGTSNYSKDYTLTDQTVTIYGDVTSIFCIGQQLTALDVTENPVLTLILCNDNQLTTLSVGEKPVLTELHCYRNQLTALDVTGCPALTLLDCNSNQLAAIDVTQNTALTKLNVGDNPLTTLDVSQNTALTELRCYSNQLTSLDVTNNSALEWLYCHGNQLTSLDVTKNPVLSSLQCGNNQLTSLDVSKNPKLTWLDCNNNQLTLLDVSKNTALKNLYCYSNQLTSLDVSSCPVLYLIDCRHNHLTALALVANTKLTSSDSKVNSQTKTVDCTMMDGYIVVPIDNVAENGKVSNIKVNGTSYTNDDETYVVSDGEGNKYLVIGDGDHIPADNADGKVIVTYNYYTDAAWYSAQNMDVALSTTMAGFNKIVMTTSKEIGETITMAITYTGEVLIGGATGTIGASGDLSTCTLTSQTVTVFGKVSQFTCSGQSLTALDVTEAPYLSRLFCANNQLATLDVSKNTDLTMLQCQNNQMTSLNVTGATSLMQLQCQDNQLETLDVSGCSSLTTLDCSNNQLATLDVSGCTYLYTLNCSNNQLETLDVTQNANLYGINCEANQLTTLTLADNGNLYWGVSIYDCSVKDQAKAVECSMISNYFVVPINNDAQSAKVSNINVTGIGAYDPATKVLSDGEGNKYLVIGDPLHVPADGTVTVTYDYATDGAATEVETMNVTLTTTVPTHRIVLTTSKEIGETINLKLRYTGDVIIDGVSEAVGPSDAIKNYTLTSQTVTIYGNNLTVFACSYNSLTALDVTGAPALTVLLCSGNQLTELDVTQNTSLKVLDCIDNQLTELDVTNNTALTDLGCNLNQLTTLTLAGNTAITDGIVSPQVKTVECSIREGYFVMPINNDAENDKVSNIKPSNTGTIYNPATKVLSDGEGNKYLVIGDAENAPVPGADGYITVSYDYDTEASLEDIKTMNVSLRALFSTPALNKIILVTADDAEVSTIKLRHVYTGSIIITGVEETPAASNEEEYNEYTLTSKTVIIYGDVTKLLCTNHPLVSVTAEDHSTLGYLDCSGSSSTPTLESVNVEGSTALHTLGCSNGLLESLDVSTNTALHTLNCNNNKLPEIDVRENTALTSLNCSSNLLDELNVRNNTELTYLACNHNKLEQLDVTSNRALQNLYCAGNLLTSINLTQNADLRILYCHENQIGTLYVGDKPELTTLYCYSNQLRTLDVNENAKLKQLWCGSNLLANLDVTQNLVLEDLDCSLNHLVALDVTNNADLKKLDCGGNRISSLDLSRSFLLENLYCESNELEDLDLSEQNELKRLMCKDNHLMALDLSENTKLLAADLSPQTRDVTPALAGDYLGIQMPDYATRYIPGTVVGDPETGTGTSTVTDIEVAGTGYDPDEPMVTDGIGRKYLNVAALKADLHYGDHTQVTYKYNTLNDEETVWGGAEQMAVTLTFRNAHVQKVTAAGQGTLYLDYPAEVPEGASVHYCTEANIDRVNQKMLTTKIGDAGIVVPENTGFLTVAPAGYYLFNRSEGTPETVVGNIMEGTTEDLTVEARSVLTLGRSNSTGKYGFWIYTGTKLSAWRTWIPVSYIGDLANAKGFDLIYDDGETTHVSRTEATDIGDGAVYDLAGRKVAEPGEWNEVKNRLPKGVYIMGGKKIVNK